MEPEQVLGVRPSTEGQPEAMEVLLQWRGLPAFKATWESFSTIQEQYPDFHLEDNVKLWATGNVRPPIRFTFVRRNRA